jgi:hypothetical protein
MNPAGISTTASETVRAEEEEEGRSGDARLVCIV